MNQTFFSRIALLALAASLLSTTAPALAADPASGAVSTTAPVLTFTSGPNLVSNPAADCSIPMACDFFALTLNLPADYKSRYPDAQVKVELTWDLDVDYDLAAEEGGNSIATAGATGSPEVMTFAAGQGTRNITINIIPFAVSGGTANGKITLIPGAMATPPAGGGGGTPSSGAETPIPANPVGPEVPRYYIYAPPPGLNGSTGEPSVGYNPATGNAFILSGLKTLWAQFPQRQNPALPAACEASWEERSAPETNKTTLDPIGFTDSLVGSAITGRTFIGQLGSKVHLMAFTDDDGKTWTPSEGNAPVTQGFDHQTIGAGPYPKTGAGSLIPHPLYANAVYYCSQDLAYANCARSDNGGLTFGASVPMYTLADCGGIHGHVRVGPDGTVYVPNPGCGGLPTAAVSEDAGLSWTLRPVTTASGEAGRDPQVAVASDGTAYMCFLEGLNKAYMAVSKNKGVTWSKPVELGAGLGLKHAVFTQAVAGDPDRAACGFLGSTAVGNSNALDYKGTWYLFVASTFDGGKTYTTVNATPNDPVQGYGGVWDGGGGNYNRNLLDFNEMSLDENGNVIYGFADGCIGACVNDPTNNSFSAFPKIARQVGGKSLFAKAGEAVLKSPAAACLAGDRTIERSFLSWREPENGGAGISNYRIYRGTAAGQETFIGNAGAKAIYKDATADPAVAKYYYKITGTNAKGEGVFSNTIELPIAAPPSETICKTPGPLVPDMTDALGDSATDANADLVSLRIAEPQTLDGKLVMTLKIASLATPTPNSMYTVRFHTPADDIASGNDHFVGLVFDGGALPSYVYGSTTVTTVVLVSVTQYDIAGKLDAASTYNADGTITLVVPRSLFGLKAGDRLKNMTANVHTGATSTGSHVARSTTTLDGMGGPGDYAARSAMFCLANANPLAALVVNKNSSAVGESLQFSAAGASDADADAIVEYFFDFGDGAQATQSSPLVTHAYDKEGPYRAYVQVKDARGLSSTNVAQQMIAVSKAGTVVTPAPGGTPTIGGVPTAANAASSGQGRFGGSLGAALLGLLACAGWSRRRLRS